VLSVTALGLLFQVFAMDALLGGGGRGAFAGSRAEGAGFGCPASEDLRIFAGIGGGIEDFEAKS